MNSLKTLFLIFPKKIRLFFVVVVFLLLIGSLLEMIGVALLFPMISYLINPQELNFGNFDFLAFTELFSNDPLEVILILILIIFTFKTIYLSILSWIQISFTFSITHYLSEYLFKIYLNQPYQFHIENKSAELIRNCTTEINKITNGFVNSLLNLFVEVVIIVSISILLIVYEPVGFLYAASFFFIIGFLIIFISKKPIYNFSLKYQFFEGFRMKHLIEGIRGNREIKISIKEIFFTKLYSSALFKTIKYHRLITFFQSLPRLWLEFIAVITIVLVILILKRNGNDLDSIVLKVAFFSAAAFKILPSMNKLMSSFQIITSSMPSINLVANHSFLKKNYDEYANLKIKKINLKNLIFQDVSFKYINEKNYVLKNINFNINAGNKIGVIGQSGSGKTTIINMISGVLEPSSGSITYNNKNSLIKDIASWRSIIGYVPQNVILFDNSIEQNIALGTDENNIDKKRINEVLKLVNLDSFVSSLPNKAKTQIAEGGHKLSGGQRQRIGIARALYNKPQLLLLDEATSSLDAKTEAEIIEYIYDLDDNITIMIISHRISTLYKCDSIFEVKNNFLSKVKNKT